MPEASEPNPSTALALFGVLAGPRRGEEISIATPVVTIGQGPQNDVVLDDDSVSRLHARLEFELGSWMLTDLESTNGTAVEGTRLAPGVPTPLAYAAVTVLSAIYPAAAWPLESIANLTLTINVLVVWRHERAAPSGRHGPFVSSVR